MNRVLCACDLSPGSDGILQVAATMAAALGDSLEILHVVEPPSRPDSDAVVALVASARAAAAKELERQCQTLARFGIPVSALVEVGRADEIVIGTAEASKPQLLVMATHGRGPLIRTLVGSVAERGLRRAPCPILIVPPGAVPSLAGWSAGLRPLRITVGVDTSPAIETTLAWLAGLRGKVPCDLNLVHLYWPPQESRRLGIPCGGRVPDDQDEIAQIVARELRSRVGRIPGQGDLAVRVQADWGEDEAPLALAAERAGADILVLGTSVGSGASTAIKALRQGKTAVLCVPGVEAQAGRATKGAAQIHAVAAFTDLSDAGNAAVAESLWLLRGQGGILTVCHVATPGASVPSPGALESQLRVLADGLIKNGAKHPGVEIHTLVHQSPTAAEGIIEAIGRIGPDMVVLGSRAREPSGAVGHVIDGTAETVGRLARVPVVIAPPPRPATASQTQSSCAPH